MEWISVNDKLPEMDVPVLVYTIWEKEEYKYIVLYLSEGDEEIPFPKGWFGGGEYYLEFAFDEVTHWMPLPLPPK